MGIRTPDLLNAIEALYQLSYDPERLATLHFFGSKARKTIGIRHGLLTFLKFAPDFPKAKCTGFCFGLKGRCSD